MADQEKVQQSIERFEYELAKPLDRPWQSVRNRKPTTSELQADRDAFLALQSSQK